MDNHELIMRNVEEVVTKEEIRNIIENPKEKLAYVGYEPSGSLHLGHMLTANKLIDLQNIGLDVTILLADLHAYLNGKGELEKIKEIAEEMKNEFIRFGLDREKTKFVLGSEFQLEKDYIMDLHSLSIDTTINRAKRSVAEVAREGTKVGEIIYPLMQALDIAYLDVDLAVGGTDQRKIHMLAREELPKIGYKAPTSLHTPIMTGLNGEGKMSSSEGNLIATNDSKKQIKEKITNAYCPPKTEKNPIAEIYKYHIFPRFEKIRIEREKKYGGDIEYKNFEEFSSDVDSGKLHPQDMKQTLTEYLHRLITTPPS